MTNPVREAIPEETARLVRSVLSADLLKPKYRTGNLAGNSAYGHCYAASEACFYLLGGRSSPWRRNQPSSRAGSSASPPKTM